MQIENLLKENGLAHIVKNIFVLEGTDPSKHTVLPFYADGLPGVIYKKTNGSAILLPAKKKLSEFFLYGQTLEPIEISVEGAYRLVVFQLYPHAIKLLFGLNPQALNDNCYNLVNMDKPEIAQAIDTLKNASGQLSEIKCMVDFLKKLDENHIKPAEAKVQQAIEIILSHPGKLTVKALADQLHTTERTLQRQFIAYVGISPKRFAKIIQFDHSVHQIYEAAHPKFTDIAFKNGYADQSHFIRNVRKYTRKKPSDLKH